MDIFESKEFGPMRRLMDELKKPLPGFDAQRVMMPSFRRDSLLSIPEQVKKGAVLILLYGEYEDLTMCLIKRTVDGSVHSGQISLPGGKMEESDLDIVHTALREAHEEIGVRPELATVLGLLSSLYIPVSNYLVFPIVAYTPTKPQFVPNSFEVDELIEVSIKLLLNPEIRGNDTIVVNDMERQVPAFIIGKHKIWGATAMILNEFMHVFRNGNR
jgi:8-oxo-dGTP pyrophosphatase MutT (NUDIX family)